MNLTQVGGLSKKAKKVLEVLINAQHPLWNSNPRKWRKSKWKLDSFSSMYFSLVLSSPLPSLFDDLET